ncbi:hypothetical protein Vadar_003624 [Vaccinium darrowii]|uniref:Uncharacterized protein n=1 Tax=Vaccinium darrowii TaxID=229202 RepID=A0ACB7XXX3_9ERIC|nr:hypothetical protein Vadar_003624 [Vaccinium darrowii]
MGAEDGDSIGGRGSRAYTNGPTAYIEPRDFSRYGFYADMADFETLVDDAVEDLVNHVEIGVNDEVEDHRKRARSEHNELRRQKIASRGIASVCVGALLLASTASFEDLPWIPWFIFCGVGVVLLSCGLIVLTCIDQDDAWHRLDTQEVKVHLYGCDCYAYALLASGFVDLVIESGLKLQQQGTRARKPIAVPNRRPTSKVPSPSDKPTLSRFFFERILKSR